MLTDAEINLAIAQIEYPNEPDRNLTGHNYCTDWADVGEVIERQKITVGYNDTERLYFAHDGYGNAITYAETPTKAAALCYLKMKGVEV